MIKRNKKNLIFCLWLLRICFICVLLFSQNYSKKCQGIRGGSWAISFRHQWVQEITSFFRADTLTHTYAYSVFISIKYTTPKINQVMILFQFRLSRAQSSLDFCSANVLFPWSLNVRKQIKCDLHSKNRFLLRQCCSRTIFDKIKWNKYPSSPKAIMKA